jgi:hypothetical protein
VIADGTGVEWRCIDGVIQHRYASWLYGPEGKPGPWITTPDVDLIVHPWRVRAIAAARANPEAR